MPKHTLLENDNRGRVQYVDAVMGFATLVTFMVVAPWVYGAISMATDVLPPLSATLIRLSISMFVIAMIISFGVSAQSN